MCTVLDLILLCGFLVSKHYVFFAVLTQDNGYTAEALTVHLCLEAQVHTLERQLARLC